MTTTFEIDKSLSPVEPKDWMRKQVPGFSSFRKWTTAEAFEMKLREYKRGEYTPGEPMDEWTEIPILEGASERQLHSSTGAHGFMEAAHHAYDCHLPLTIRPDHVWMLVVQAVAKSLETAGEQHRDAFVAHQGQQYIEIRRDGFIKGNPLNDWAGCFAEFSSLMEKFIHPNAYKVLRADFSTTQGTERAAADVAFMDAMKKYFSYGMRTCCGIPRVTLEGDKHEWADIYDRFQELDELVADSGGFPWAHSMTTALSEFKKAAEGGASKTTWEDFFKLRAMGSGGPNVTGWINGLFPHAKGTHPEDYGAGFSTVPVKWLYYAEKFDMRFASGFIGTTLNLDDDHAVSPEMGWCIYEQDNITKGKYGGGAFGTKEDAEYIRIDD
jgi:hypothetical protein